MRMEHLDRSKRYKVICLGRMIYIYIFLSTRPEKGKGARVRCIGKILKPKKLKASLSENQELRDKLKQMEKNKIVQMRCWQMCCQ
jgi:hypothetical protein